MSIIDEIPQKDLEMMDNWRLYCCERANTYNFISSKQLLEPWADAKQDLFLLLGGLKISKEVQYTKSYEEIEEDYTNEIRHSIGNSAKHSPNKFINEYSIWCDKMAKQLHRELQEENNNVIYAYYSIECDLRSRINAKAVINNEINPSLVHDALNNIKLPDGKILKVMPGMKTMKYLSKIATAFGLEGFEDFRIWQSLLTNNRKFKGKLTLSIHPMDFMTMSDNNCGWNTCMSWGYEHEGDYRFGTTEMLNSPYVVCAYLESAEPMSICNHYSWNSKKWRQLFIVRDDIIVNVKAYPYNNIILTKEVIDWLKDLVASNWGVYYQNEEQIPYDDAKFIFETDNMYNDFNDTDVPRFMFYNDPEKPRHINYSGPMQCMICGQTYPDVYDNDLWCVKCDNSVVCEDCGQRLDLDTDAYELDGKFYCSTCYEDVAFSCNYCCEDHHEDEMYNITVVDNDKDVGYIMLCSACYDDLIEYINDSTIDLNTLPENIKEDLMRNYYF